MGRKVRTWDRGVRVGEAMHGSEEEFLEGGSLVTDGTTTDSVGQ